jgi:SAM-dependent methyltransferase
MTTLEVFNRRQKRGRDAEWDALKPFLRERAPGLLLDVGCGTGYAMAQAQELGFQVVGVDPEFAKYGVRDESVNAVTRFIVPALAEHLPFPDHTFDVVYSSHAIEHFMQVEAGVAELARVLKPEGRAVLMIPTGTMAAIRMPSLWLFYTHRSIGRFLWRTRSPRGFNEIFLGPAHGTEARYAIQEMSVFSIKRWRELIARQLTIEDELRPCLYPWPNYPPLFPLLRLKRFSTSVAFICARRPKN